MFIPQKNQVIIDLLVRDLGRWFFEIQGELGQASTIVVQGTGTLSSKFDLSQELGIQWLESHNLLAGLLNQG